MQSAAKIGSSKVMNRSKGNKGMHEKVGNVFYFKRNEIVHF